jgi:hypothetical protein
MQWGAFYVFWCVRGDHVVGSVRIDQTYGFYDINDPPYRHIQKVCRLARRINFRIIVRRSTTYMPESL